MSKKISSKIKSNKAETLVETLAALLIVVVSMTMLAGAIVSAARVNKNASKIDTGFSTVGKLSSGATVSTEEELSGFTVKVKDSSGVETEIEKGTIKAYQVGTVGDDDTVNYDDPFIYYTYSADEP